ncbi:hypothetical protein BJ165DRAFT_459281 [Panaeolus papilionaceus]|nr:hypothetical protein BJ165DRAFT_459281 [Panaeolus papilionaceus]
MATLHLQWSRTEDYHLWAWDMGKVHHTAVVVQRVKSNMHIAQLGLAGDKEKVPVAIKLARGEAQQETLLQEYGFYTRDLKELQGTVVPKCYGFFRGRVHGVKLGCLVLEYCFEPQPDLNQQAEFYRKAMIAACKLHYAGLVHGDLLSGRHIIGQGNEPRIIDFSKAIRHTCQNGVPTNPYEHNPEKRRFCQELMELERHFSLVIDGPTTQQVIYGIPASESFRPVVPTTIKRRNRVR